MNEKKGHCRNCVGMPCKEIAEAGGYSRWGCLTYYLQMRQHTSRKLRKLESKLVKAARAFLPKEWKITHCNDGSFLVDTPGGRYIWYFPVEIQQEKIWNFPEFQEGHKFGTSPVEPCRDANPYQEPSRHRSWDCGYILALWENEG